MRVRRRGGGGGIDRIGVEGDDLALARLWRFSGRCDVSSGCG